LFIFQNKQVNKLISDTLSIMLSYSEGINDNKFPHSPAFFQILIRGHFDAHWAQRFEGLTITPLTDG
jgi:hypothetical protein